MAEASGTETLIVSTRPTEVEKVTIGNVTSELSPSEPVQKEGESTVDTVFDKPEEANKPKTTEEPADAEMKEVKKDEVAQDAGKRSEEEDMKEDSKANGKEEKSLSKKAKRRMNRKKASGVGGSTSNASDKPAASDPGKEEISLSKKAKRRRNRKKASGVGGVTSNTSDKPAASDPEKKDVKKLEGMGLIFMCNNKTKKDCFQYKILGLPENKKDLVAKIHKNMKLFLYNVDDKMMYGIYRATSRGGYNIEPKAFNSSFPSQVRFAVFEDCKPLPEEKFRVAIKSNYSSRNKFKIELSREQVRDLRKLFKGDKKGKQGKSGGEGTIEANVSVSSERSSKVPIPAVRGRNRRPPLQRPQPRAPYNPRVQTYPAVSHAPPARLLAPLPASYPYAYERPADDYYHMRQHVEYRDPYSLYRQPASFSGPVYATRMPYALPPRYPY